jgi:hypothetical protein
MTPAAMPKDARMPKKADRINRIYKIESEGKFFPLVFNPVNPV